MRVHVWADWLGLRWALGGFVKENFPEKSNSVSTVYGVCEELIFTVIS